MPSYVSILGEGEEEEEEEEHEDSMSMVAGTELTRRPWLLSHNREFGGCLITYQRLMNGLPFRAATK